MFVLPDDYNRHTVYFDVDDTLIEWVSPGDPDAESAIVIEKPWKQLIREKNNITETLKQHKDRGDIIVVWTQGGAEWAEAVVNALNISDCVDACLTKPTICYDDVDMNQWGIDWIDPSDADPADLPETLN